MNNYKYNIFLIFFALSFSLKAEKFLLPAPLQSQPMLVVGSSIVPRGIYNIPMKIEWAEVDGVKLNYWILVGTPTNVARVPIEPNFNTPKSEEPIDLRFFLLKGVIVRDEPVQIQYVMEMKFLNGTSKIFPSRIVVTLRPEGLKYTHFWQTRPAELEEEIDRAWVSLRERQTGFGSAKEGFPCNGSCSYDLNGISTDEIIAQELRGKDISKFHILELGTANGEFLASVNKNFGLGWNQLLGISALDHRTPLSTVPDSSYLLHNIERLNLIFQEVKPVDLVISQMTWLYLADPLSAIAATYEVLKDSGLMYIHMLSWLKHQGVDMELLVQRLRAFGYEASVIWGDTLRIDEAEEREAWFVLRKNPLKPTLKLPYKIIGLTPPEAIFSSPRALYGLEEGVDRASNEIPVKKRKLAEDL